MKKVVCYPSLMLQIAENQVHIREIIAVSFYSPPKSRQKKKLLDHSLTTIHILLTKYPEAGIIIGADKNDLDISSILLGVPRVRQIVAQNTYKEKILDIIVTHLHQFYLPPVVVNPVEPDDPSKAAPSDHRRPIAPPISNNQTNTKLYRTVTFRPLPLDGMEIFADWLKEEDWKF